MMDWSTVSKELAKPLNPDEAALKRLRRFMSMVEIPENPIDCWIWTGNRPDGRHGHFSHSDSASVKAHRWIYALATGREIPDGMVIRHKCDNPACVNPEHLTIGTVADNNRDREERGRSDDRRGERHPLAKLTAEDVIEIRKMASIGHTQQALAARYATSRSQIGKIVRRENWGHV